MPPAHPKFAIIVAFHRQVGMLLFNKLAIQHFPLECSLVWAQLFFSAACLILFGFPDIRVGSMKDVLRWCMVVPFYCGTWVWVPYVCLA